MSREKKIKVILGSTSSAYSSSTNHFEQSMRDDASSKVVGGIVEKNLFSKHTSKPLPTVLPFPVARYRSSGPHWKPASGIEDENVVHEAESGDITCIDSVASCAKPVQQEHKNSMNLKPFREHVLGRLYLDSEQLDEDDYVKESKRHSETPKGIEETSGGSEAKVILSSFPALNSRQSDIDSENQLRLQEMSAEEVAEAQTELKEKMAPSLIQFLRERGLSKQRNLSAVEPNGSHLEMESEKLRSKSPHKENSLGSSPSSSTNYVPETRQYTSSTNVEQNSIQECKNNQLKNFNLASSSSWDSWSQRVETVRDFRFSLEGTVISDHFDRDNFAVKSKLGADNVGERDILRSEGDPAAAGYTILEAVQLTRSVIPGQRSIALHLLASLLDTAINGLQKRVSLQSSGDVKAIDWEAVWGYVLGPEPELALVLRLCLDDNHNLVVFTCAKAIHSALTCHLNEHFFNISEKVGSRADLFTAPIFRSKPKVETGFVRGGFWKLNAKPSIILNTWDEVDEDETEKGHTIRDDVVIAEQDFAAGLVKMGIIQKLLYLLENDPSASMEEYIVSIFVAIARHSPTCANAILRCPRLINAIVQRFQIGAGEYTNYAKISSVVLLKVLAQADRKNCSEFMSKGYFQIMASNLFHPFSSLNGWIKLGKERRKFFSKLIVEQLRYWKVCINYEFGLSYFPTIFSTLCLWLVRPSQNNLLDDDLFREFASVSAEAFLVLRSLARRLPNLYYRGQINSEDEEKTDWEWSFVTPLVDSALYWLTYKNSQYLCNLLASKNVDKALQCSFLWVLSSVFHFLSALLERIVPQEESRNDVPWLPEFVPLIGLEVLKQRFLWCPNEIENSFVAVLCSLRDQDDEELSLASTSCLSSLLSTVTSVDNLIKLGRSQTHNISCTDSSFEAKLLEEGISQRCFLDLKMIFDSLSGKICSEGVTLQSMEAFGRGGPAPGVGIGWGVPGGGFWSTKYTLMRQESEILCHLLTRAQDFNCAEDSSFCRLSLVLEICLTFGASDRENCAKVFDCLFGVPVLKQLGSRVQIYFRSTDSSFDLGFTEDDYSMFSARLLFHYSNFWLSAKQKAAKHSSSLSTIHENTEDNACIVEISEWANQRLPLPLHWLCSSIATSPHYKYTSYDVFRESYDGKEITKSGLFFLLGVETLPSTSGVDIASPVCRIPLMWKLHSLSASLLSDLSVLEDFKSRGVYEALQDIYGGYLEKCSEVMRFQTEIHQNYCTFVETLVEQFSAESYGDVVFGRQVAIYLQSRLEAPVKLAAWNALSNARALDILPALENCMGKPDAYLSPIEDNDSVLEAYVKSWISGALDRAFTRGSMAFVLAAHHISSFVFAESNGNISLKKKLVKFLVRDYAASPKRQEMMMYLMRYNGYPASKCGDDVDTKFCVLVEACDNDSSLLRLAEKLRSNFA